MYVLVSGEGDSLQHEENQDAQLKIMHARGCKGARKQRSMHTAGRGHYQLLHTLPVTVAWHAKKREQVKMSASSADEC